MAKAKSTALAALDYLDRPEKHPPRPVCIAFGDEPFLKREVLRTLRRQILGEDDGEFSLTTVAGRDADLRDIRDELSTVSMFGPTGRMVVVEEADDFVSQFRGELEDYLAAPARGGTLVLDVRQWAANTRLYKAVAAEGLQIECKQPAPARLRKWLISRAKSHHRATLDAGAAEALLDSLEPEAGLLDQELARLALLVGEGGTITPTVVEENVGSWRTRTTWDLIDEIAAGHTAEALAQLDRLITAGETPIGLSPQVASVLRRFTTAARIVQRAERAGRRISLQSALEQAGVKRFGLSKAQEQIKQIGRVRAGQLTSWLLEFDLAVKGPSSSPARSRLALEQLIGRLSPPAKPVDAKR